MHNMEETILKQRLLAIGYADDESLDHTVSRLLNLDGKAKEMLQKWLKDGSAPSFEAIGGVSSKFLREQLSMKDPAIIIAYYMLLLEPEENSRYFRHLADTIVDYFPPKE